MEDMKDKYLAAILALFLGFAGVHCFYLGRRFEAIIAITYLFLVLKLGAYEWLLIPAFLGFRACVRLFKINWNDFNTRYNR